MDGTAAACDAISINNINNSDTSNNIYGTVEKTEHVIVQKSQESSSSTLEMTRLLSKSEEAVRAPSYSSIQHSSNATNNINNINNDNTSNLRPRAGSDLNNSTNLRPRAGSDLNNSTNLRPRAGSDLNNSTNLRPRAGSDLSIPRSGSFPISNAPSIVLPAFIEPPYWFMCCCRALLVAMTTTIAINVPCFEAVRWCSDHHTIISFMYAMCYV